MGRIYRAWMRFWNIISFGLVGRIDAAAEAAAANPHAVRGGYDEVIREKQARARQLQTSMSRLTAIQVRTREERNACIKGLEERTRLAAGALKLLKAHVAKLQAQGLTREQIEADNEYMKLVAAWGDRNTTAQQLEREIKEKQVTIEQLEKDIEEVERDILSLSRECQELGAERERSVADVIRAKEMVEAAQAARNIAGPDTTAELLQRLRSQRVNAVGAQEASRRLRGTDQARLDRDLDKAAREAEYAGQLGELLWGEQPETAAPATPVTEAPAGGPPAGGKPGAFPS